MSTLNLLPKIILNGNGTQNRFDFPFPVKEPTEIEVYVLRQGTSVSDIVPPMSFLEYDVEIGTAKDSGGTIVFPGPNSKESVLSKDDKICIMRKSKLGNDYLFSNQTRLLPESVEDADDSLSLQIMDLARDLYSSVKASPFDTRSPEERWSEMSKALKEAQNIIQFINTEYLTLPAQLSEEKQERAAQDAAILSTVAANKEDCNQKISSLSSRLDTETSDRKKAEEGFVKLTNMTGRLSAGIGVTEDKNSVTLRSTLLDPKNGNLSTSTFALPVASEAQHGVMPKEAYATLSELGSRVSLLESGQAKTYALSLGTGELTQQNYQLAWENAAGVEPGSIPPDGTRITNIDTNIDAQYYVSSGLWVERQSLVPLATSTSTGVVKGSFVAGQIAVEQDGTMSLNGYDSLVSQSTTTSGAVSAEADRAQAAEEELQTSIDDHVANSVRHVSQEEKDAWNNKYSKLDSGIPLSDLDVSVQNKINDALSKSEGGAVIGKLTVRNSTENASFEARNISFTDTDPGTGSELASGCILMVFE